MLFGIRVRLPRMPRVPVTGGACVGSRTGGGAEGGPGLLLCVWEARHAQAWRWAKLAVTAVAYCSAADTPKLTAVPPSCASTNANEAVTWLVPDLQLSARSHCCPTRLAVSTSLYICAPTGFRYVSGFEAGQQEVGDILWEVEMGELR